MADDRTEEQQLSEARTGGAPQAQVPAVRWDDSNLKSSYANVCNVSSTREEVVLLFGINQAWQGGQREVTVQLTDRLILSPFVAKRLSILLTNVIREYEARFNPLNLEPRRPDEP
ncbi:MAG: DUF3467 domain-containing protein [Candidatus Tectomicrobia bacterium]|nr:DUF3467 domain-containing protein [Candidatus Tectomicrobia bacterium]